MVKFNILVLMRMILGLFMYGVKITFSSRMVNILQNTFINNSKKIHCCGIY